MAADLNAARDAGAERDPDATFERWIGVLREDVIQVDYGYEPGEFTVFPEHWRAMFDEGLTPNQAFERALVAHAEGEREEEDARKANAERVRREDAALHLADRAPPAPRPDPSLVAPAGVEAMAEALFYTSTWTNKDIMWPDAVRDCTTISQGIVRHFRQQAAAILARLAVPADPAPAALAGAVLAGAQAVADALDALTFPQITSLALFEAAVALRAALKEERAHNAALAEGAAGGGWRPIETLRGDEGPVWFAWDGSKKGTCGAVEGVASKVPELNPSHWARRLEMPLPLPAPPSVEGR